MKGYSVYNAIQQLKEQGFRKAAVARQLSINRRTVDRYWDMPVDEYQSMHTEIRKCQYLDEYRDTIIGWIEDYPDMSAAQICDWLKENYEVDFKDRTVSRYVSELRKSCNLPKHKEPRSYEAVPELPMGQQVQVDFGQISLKNLSGGNTKVYAVGFVLSHSRYKYAECQSRPFTATDLVRSCYRCFNYFGGMPKEMVFDQDSIVCVSENIGDIIYTYEFEKFRQECRISIYMCRGADPESKGKIENTIKYIKGNFLNHRIFIDDVTLNESCLKWLERTANAKVHGTTKRIPAEVFKLERESLRPLTSDVELPDAKVSRTVRKDNTIIYDSNRYSVPFDTYNKHKEVKVEDHDGILFVYTLNGEPLCQHSISYGRGNLIINTDHKRDKSSALDKLQASIDERLDHEVTSFLAGIRAEKPRYSHDHFQMINSLIDLYGPELINEAISFCDNNKLYSANTVKDYLENRKSPEPVIIAEIDTSRIPVSDPKFHIKAEKRSLDVYKEVGDNIAITC